MAKNRITNDMEYWQLKEDYGRSLLAARNEEDKKKKKELEKEAAAENKLLSAYEKKKIKRAKEQQKEEEKLARLQESRTAEKKIFFEVSTIEARYIDYSSLTKQQREKLAVKKESLLQMINKGMYIRIKGDTGLYQVKQSEKRMNGLKYINTSVYGNVAIQDVALIIEKYFYEAELDANGHSII